MGGCLLMPFISIHSVSLSNHPPLLALSLFNQLPQMIGNLFARLNGTAYSRFHFTCGSPPLFSFFWIGTILFKHFDQI